MRGKNIAKKDPKKQTKPLKIQQELKLPPITKKSRGVVAASAISSRRSSMDTNFGFDYHVVNVGATAEPDNHGYLQSAAGRIHQESLFDHYLSSDLGIENEQEFLAIIKGTHGNVTAESPQANHSGFAVSLFDQIKTLLERSHVNSTRNPGFKISWIVGSVSFLFYGLVYLGLRTSSLAARIQNDVQVQNNIEALDYWDSQRAFIFQIVTAIVFLQLETLTSGERICLTIAHLEKGLFLREYAGGGYSALAYHLSWVMRQNTCSLFRALLFPPLVYFTSGLAIEVEKYSVFCIVFAIMDSVGSSLALLLVCCSVKLERSSISFTIITSLTGSACGFFLRPTFIPPWFSWLFYSSWYKYALNALYINHFSGVIFNGTEVLSSIFGLDGDLDLWENLAVLIIFPMVFHIIAYGFSCRGVNA